MLDHGPVDAAPTRHGAALTLPHFRSRRLGQSPGQHAADAVRGRPRRAAGPQRDAVAGGGRGDLPAALAAAQPVRAGASQSLYRASQTFLGNEARRCRSSSAWPAASPWARAPPRACCRRCSRAGPTIRRWTLVTTDGFLFPNAVLEARGLMNRKGFPESYDRARPRALPGRRQGRLRRSACPRLLAPALRHRARRGADGAPPRRRHRRRPERAAGAAGQLTPNQLFASDFFDYSLYVDARERDIE